MSDRIKIHQAAVIWWSAPSLTWAKPDEQRQRAFQRRLVDIAHWQWWGGIVLVAELN